MKLLNEPSAIKVGLFLCMANLVLGLFSYAIEYIVGKELPGTAVLVTVMPAIITGMWFGYKSGQLMPPKTRWNSLLIWLGVCMCYMFIFAQIVDISLYEIMAEFGWFNLALLAILFLTLVITYFVLKSGEKIGIKSLLKNKEKLERSKT